MARQATNFHKCHRCIYRGQAADWEPKERPLVIEVAEREAHASAAETKVMIPRPQVAARQGSTHG